MTVADFLRDVLGPDVPVEFRAYDGSRFGPSDATTAVVVRSPDALRRIVTAPDELGFGRAYVAGDFAIEGDMFAVLQMLQRLQGVKVRPAQIVAALEAAGRARDAAAPASSRGGPAARRTPLEGA